MAADELLASSEVLQRIKFYFDVLQQATGNYPFIMDLRTGITMLPPRMVEEYDLPGNILKDFGKHWDRLVYHEDEKRYKDSMRAVFVDHAVKEQQVEYRVQTRQGEYKWVRCHGIMSEDEQGQPYIFVGIITRMTRRIHADHVTGLLNRYSFEMAIKEALEDNKANGTKGAVIIIGLDNFRLINETFNHHVGDMAMKQIAQSISNILPTHLNLYKLDGDEFGVIWPNATDEDVEIIFYSVQLSLREAKEINDKILCTASAGAVFYPEGGGDEITLQKHAEAALEMSKRQGKDRMCTFSPAEYKKWIQFISLEKSFEDSIQRGCEGFHLYYQPQVDAVTQKLTGAEALLRWEEPDGEIMSPLLFIPILEKTRLIIPVGRWIIEEAIKTCKKWQAYMPDFQMSINISLYQLEAIDFKGCVQEALERYDVRPESIILELTESQSVSNWDFVNEQFNFFRKLGLKVAMDDFGVGYSSLALLKHFNCDIVKVDRMFVQDILTSEFDRKLVKYIVMLCHSIGMTVCIEGVEEKESYEYLTNECGADSIQGFYFGRPEPEDVFVERFAKYTGER